MKKSFILTILMRAILSGLILDNGSGQKAKRGNIAGVVLDDVSGEPLFGASIYFEGISGSYRVRDTLGRFWLPSIPVGEYNLWAGMIGYNQMRVSHLRVTDGMTSLVAFRLSTTLVTFKKRRVGDQWQRWQDNKVSCDSTEFFQHYYKKLLRKNTPPRLEI